MKDKNKNGKEKKEKKKEPVKIFGALTPVLGPLPSPLSRLPPLRRLNVSGPDPPSGNVSALSSSHSSSRGLELFKPTTGDSDIVRKTSSSSMEEERKRMLREREDRVHLFQEELRREEEEETKKLKEKSEAMLERLRVTLEKERSAEHDRLYAQKKQDIEHMEAELREQLDAERTRLQDENKKKMNALKKKESELQGQADQLELRAKELKREEDALQTKIADLNRRKTKIGEEEKELDRQRELIRERDQLREELERMTEEKQQAHEERSKTKEKEKQLIEERDHLSVELTRTREEKCQACELIQRAREERIEAKEEKEQLREERDQLKEELERMREENHQAQEVIQRVREDMSKAKEEEETRLREGISRAREESRRAKEDKEKLESRVMLLQERCEHLRHRVGELEKGERSPSLRQDKKKEEEKTKMTTPSSDRKDALLQLDDSPPLSPLPDIQSNMDKLPCYISSRLTSTHKPSVFVERGSSQQKERQTAQCSVSLDFNMVTEDVIRDLLQEVRNVSQLEQKVRRVKEDQIQQLKSVKSGEPLSENLSGVAGEKRVTGDVPESDLSSTVDSLVRTGGHPVASGKVLESLQQISNHFNSVLSTLGSVAQRPYAAFPLSTNEPHFSSSLNPVTHQTHTLGPDSVPPPPSTRLPEPLWNWATQRNSAATALYSGPASCGLKACDDLRFSGVATNPVTSNSMMSTSAYSSYTPLSKYGNSLCSVEMDGQSLQRRIDGMKIWLEMRKKDTSTPLLTRYQVTSSEKDLT